MVLEGRAARRFGALACVCLIATGCVFEFEETKQREHDKVGAEVFRVVCMNLASQAFPNDLTGEKFTSRCEGTETKPFVELTPQKGIELRALHRYNTLIARRGDLVPALDAVFGSELFQKDELRDFLSNLIPLYDPPSLFPEVTRETARLLQGLIDQQDDVSKAAIDAFERMSSRDGYRPLRQALGIARPALNYPDLDTVVTTTLESLNPKDGSAREAWEDLLKATALDLATADATAPDPQKPGSLAVARKLLLAQDAAFSSGRKALWLAERDYRGLAQPNRLAMPFSDANGDGFADVDPLGRLVVDMAQAPTPFKTLTATLLSQDPSQRDGVGRALNPFASAQDLCAGSSPAPGCGEACANDTPCPSGLICGSDGTCAADPLLYRYIDADRTLLAAVTRDVNSLLIPKDAIDKKLTVAAIHDFAYGLNALLGDYKQRTYEFGKTKHAFVGPDTTSGPIFDLVYALGNLMPFAETDQLLQVVEVLTRDHEPELAGLIEAALYIDQRADSYPNANWEKPHDFWDDVIVWTQRAMKRPGMLEALLRALATDESAKAGPLIGNFMRFKDRVSYPMGKQEELEALGIDLKQVPGKLTTATSAAVQANREHVNYPCDNPPRDLVGGSVSDPQCRPTAPHPAKNHKGIRGCAPGDLDCTQGCPAAQPEDGASCAAAAGYGLCSWDTGSCTCDCAGGLCRGDMTPTWSCNGTSVPGYELWVDRSQPDNRVGADGLSNQSLFQRTAALVHDLHVPAKLCNKDGAEMKLYTPPGSNSEILGGTLGTGGGLLGPFEPCELLNETQIVQFFAQAILGKAELQLKADTLNGLLGLLDRFNINGLTGDSIMERQSQLRGLVIKGTTPQAVARMVFSPFNNFEDHLLELPVTRDNKLIVDLHRDTIFAWEIPDPVVQASFYQALTPLLTALDSNEARADDGTLIDGYLFGDLISIVHRHWSSRATDATVRTCDDTVSPPKCDETAPLFAYQSNGVSYEELAAEALVDAKILERLRDVMRALDTIEVAPGVDGIDVLVNATNNLLDPAKSCTNGDCVNNPLKFRDGRSSTTSNTGVTPIAQIAPAHLIFDALNAIDKRFEGNNEKRLEPWRQARSQLVDMLLDVDRTAPGAWYFKNPRSKPVLLKSVGFLRERLAVYRAEQEACVAGGGTPESCQQLREWAVGLTGRMEKSLGQPVSAATLRLLEQFWGQKADPGGELLKLVHFISKENMETAGDGANDAFDSTLLSATDMLQLFENTPNTAPVMRFLSRAIAPNAIAVADEGTGDLKLADGSLEKTLQLLREIKKLDTAPKGQQSTLTKLLRAMVQVHGKNGETPLEIIIDVIAEVNRANPGKDAGKSLDGNDLRAVLNESQDFLSSKRHGIERLYDIIEERKLK